ncbi:hypothetical protein [Phenylobacterium sp.]|uniref:hypothetical protein n=1 Tax=Phenylobacterium sp. TaxID=1871053 RepID=UPI002CF93F4D|nr:hypothetical protein [Phenylobacterium sp.]HLZ74578.1 hypothetical protein [Phenylobacterium sp.]
MGYRWTMSPRTILASAAATLLLGLAPSALAADPNDVLPDGPGKDVVVRACTSCHEASEISEKPRTSSDWTEVIGKMIDNGAQLTPQEQDAVYAYVLKHFGKPDGGDAAPPAPGPKPPSR